MCHETASLRQDLMVLTSWVRHWQEDAKSRLPVTETSTSHALMVIDRASKSLDRIDASLKEPTQ